MTLHSLKIIIPRFLKSIFLASILFLSADLSYSQNSQAMARVKIKNKYGYVDRKGTLVIPAQFEEAEDFREGIALVKFNDKHEYIDRTGTVVTTVAYGKPFSEGLAAIRTADKWGYINKTGKMVIAENYDSVDPFHDGLASVAINDKWYYIDTTGKVVLPVKSSIENLVTDFCFIERNHDKFVITGCGLGATWVEFDNKIGYTYNNETVIVPQQFQFGLWHFQEGLAPFVINHKFGYINKAGKIVVPAIFDVALDFKDGFAYVESGWGNGYINRDCYDTFAVAGTHLFNEGLALVSGNKDYYIDKYGVVVIQGKYIGGGDFHEGLAFMKTRYNGPVGYIDKTGKVVIPFQFSGARNFQEGLAAVKIHRKWGYIDKKGTLVIPAQFDETWDFN
jgi:hypothetical protein